MTEDVNPQTSGSTIPACSPTDDPAWWRMDAPCDDDCHHPVHAFKHPERMRHLIDAATANAYPHEPVKEAADV